MFKLRQTWPPYFSNAVLHNLDTRTHYIDPAWPITARVPDATPSTPTIHINPDFIQRVNKFERKINSKKFSIQTIFFQSPTTAANQPKLPARSDDHARTGNQTAGKSSESTSRDDNYHMIPIDRKEVDPILPKDTNRKQCRIFF